MTGRRGEEDGRRADSRTTALCRSGWSVEVSGAAGRCRGKKVRRSWECGGERTSRRIRGQDAPRAVEEECLPRAWMGTCKFMGSDFPRSWRRNTVSVHMAEKRDGGQSLSIQVCLPQRGWKWDEQWVRIKKVAQSRGDDGIQSEGSQCS